MNICIMKAPEGEGREKGAEESLKKYWPKYDERHECTCSRSSRNCKLDELKNIHNNRKYSKIFKSQR